MRVGEVTRPWEFPWSSAAAFVGKATAPEWLVVEEVLAHFGHRRLTAQRRYAEFLMEGVKNEVATPWAAVEGQLLLGERRWIERMKRRLGDEPVADEVTGSNELRPRPPLSAVITQVCRQAKVDRATLLRPRGARGRWARGVAMALAWEMCGLTQREIGRAFGVGPYAVAKAAARTTELAASNGSVGKTITYIKSAVQT